MDWHSLITRLSRLCETQASAPSHGVPETPVRPVAAGRAWGRKRAMSMRRRVLVYAQGSRSYSCAGSAGILPAPTRAVSTRAGRMPALPGGGTRHASPLRRYQPDGVSRGRRWRAGQVNCSTTMHAPAVPAMHHDVIEHDGQHDRRAWCGRMPCAPTKTAEEDPAFATSSAGSWCRLAARQTARGHRAARSARLGLARPSAARRQTPASRWAQTARRPVPD